MTEKASTISQINLDLVPYDVCQEGKYLVVKDCGGSVLANLEKPSRLWWNECCGDFIGGHFVGIEYDADEQQCTFETHDLDDVLKWISEHFDSMLEIGHETLRDLPQ